MVYEVTKLIKKCPKSEAEFHRKNKENFLENLNVISIYTILTHQL